MHMCGIPVQIAISGCYNKGYCNYEERRRGEERIDESRNIGWGIWNQASSSHFYEAEADGYAGE